MNRSLIFFIVCIAGIVVLTAINRWSVPVVMLLLWIFGIVGFVSGVWSLAKAMDI